MAEFMYISIIYNKIEKVLKGDINGIVQYCRRQFFQAFDKPI